MLEEPDDVESSRYNVIVPCVVHPSGEEVGLEIDSVVSCDCHTMSMVYSFASPQLSLE